MEPAHRVEEAGEADKAAVWAGAGDRARDEAAWAASVPELAATVSVPAVAIPYPMNAGYPAQTIPVQNAERP
jgi:hypothetical protein